MTLLMGGGPPHEGSTRSNKTTNRGGREGENGPACTWDRCWQPARARRQGRRRRRSGRRPLETVAGADWWQRWHRLASRRRRGRRHLWWRGSAAIHTSGSLQPLCSLSWASTSGDFNALSVSARWQPPPIAVCHSLCSHLIVQSGTIANRFNVNHYDVLTFTSL